MLKIDPITNGTVVDHISAGKGKTVLDILGIGSDYPHLVALVMNVKSTKLGKKDLVKISGIFVDESQADKIALISPGATINFIKDSSVYEKRTVSLPNEIQNLVSCPNPVCITNHEFTESRFFKDWDNYRCFFCERVFSPDELAKTVKSIK